MSVGHYPNAPRLDPVDYLRQAGREAGAPDQECLLDARGREWSRWEARDIDGQPERVSLWAEDESSDAFAAATALGSTVLERS